MASPELPSLHQPHMNLEGAPLGPDSLLWKYFDNRMAFESSAGIKQLMMHDIHAGVDQHSKFFTEVVERTLRSMVQIGGTVFDQEKGSQIGRMIRDQHIDVKGTNAQGKRYHALNPKLWADTHLTFVDGVFDVADRFDEHNLTMTEREQLYGECITWYQQYGVTDRYLPGNYADYKKRSDEMADEYVLTPTAKRALEFAVKGKLPRPNVIPAAVWWSMGVPLKPTGATGFLGKTVIAGLPEQVRDKYKKEIPYSRFDKAQMAMLETAVKLNWKNVPGPLRYPPEAYEAFRRQGRYNGLADHAYTLGSRAVANSFSRFRTLSPIKF